MDMMLILVGVNSQGNKMDNELRKLQDSKKILIYGAVRNARDAALLVEYLYPGKLIGFAVSSMNGNMDSIYGISVSAIEDYSKLDDKENICVIIAMREKFFDVVEQTLSRYDFNNILYMGDHIGIRSLLESEGLLKAERFDTIEELKNYLIKKTLSKILEEMRVNEGNTDIR